MNPTGKKMKQIFKGIIRECYYGDNYDALFIGGNEEPLAKIIQESIEEYGAWLTVSYYISELPKTLKELKENEIKKLVGATDADYSDIWSDYTGYLWTDEELNVDGHDLMAELKNHTGEYCHMTIIFEDEKKN